MSRGYSLRRRLIAALMAVIAVQFVASAIFYRIAAYETWENLHAWLLQSRARDLLALVQVGSDGGVVLDAPSALAGNSAHAETGIFYVLYDSEHRVRTAAPAAIPAGIVAAGAEKPPGQTRFMDIEGERWAITSVEAPHGYLLAVGEHRRAGEWIIDGLLFEDIERLAVSFGPLILGCLLLVWVVTAWSLRPLARASREAAAVGPAQPEARISVAGLPAEVRPVVDAVNGALDRLARAYDAERHLTADAAHELRTPLAVLSLRLERAKLASTVDWPAIESELGQLSRVIGQLLDLARKEARASTQEDMARKPVNLARIVRESAATVLPLAEEAGRSIEVQADKPVSVVGYADDLRDLVRNLLDNALVHGAGPVRVELRGPMVDAQRRAVIVVSDEGPGVPEAMREMLFDRFRKGRANSPGAGLGLAIARQVARTHGGDIGFLPGAGCRIFVSLPALQNESEPSVIGQPS